MNNIIKSVFEIFKFKDIYLIGGSVRDYLLKQPINDYDFATKYTPEEIMNILIKQKIKYYTIGKAFGTIQFELQNKKIEITTYRKNENYTKNNRKPTVDWGETIYEDLARRDFTINTIAMDWRAELIDPYGGINDLKNKSLKTPIDPDKSFSDDPLRILRAIRFATKFRFLIEKTTSNSILNNSFKLSFISRERIQEELLKILSLDNPKLGMKLMLKFKIFNWIIPEVFSLLFVNQNKKYHSKNVFKHTVDVIQNLPNDPILRLTGLLHDIAKPYVKEIINGEIHFYRHELLGSIMARDILKRLKFSNKIIDRISFLVENHMKPNLYNSNWSNSAIRRFIKDMGEYIDDIFLLSAADITSHKPERVKKHLEELNELKNRVEEQKNYKEYKTPISGKTIMEHFNLLPGKEVGKLKKIIDEAILNDKLKVDSSEKECLDYLINKENYEPK